MPRIRINASPFGTLGEVVAVEDGQVVWAGPIDALDEAGSFDALFCHDEDEERVRRRATAVELILENGGGAGVRLPRRKTK